MPDALAFRISKEFMAEYNRTVDDASDGHTAVGSFPAAGGSSVIVLTPPLRPY